MYVVHFSQREALRTAREMADAKARMWKGLGFRVQGLGFGVWGLGVWGVNPKP